MANVMQVYFYLPEIKNRTLEEIDEMFETRLPARKFRKYVCTGHYVPGASEKIERRDSEKDEVVHQEVVGVEYVTDVDGQEQTESIQGPVVFATGGFAGDVRGMVSKYRPDLAGFPSTNEAREGSQPLLVGIGAKLIDMNQIQVHPTGFLDARDESATVKFLAAEALRGEGGILLLNNGQRFVNELQTRDHVTDALTKAATKLGTDLRQWDVTLLLDEGAAAALDSHMQFYLWKGLMKKTTMGDAYC